MFCGAVVVWAPQPAWLWVSTGNPVFPFFNNIFRSPDFPPTATNFNFPYYKPHGIAALLLLPFTTSWVSFETCLGTSVGRVWWRSFCLTFRCAPHRLEP